MFMKSMVKLVALTLALGLATGSTALKSADSKKAHNLVFHVVDHNPERWTLTLNIAKKLTNDMGKENLAIEVVSHGPGLTMIQMESEVAKLVTEAQKVGVAFSACNATMVKQKVSEKDLLDGVKVVPFGAKRIMELQEAGWSYLRM